MCRMLGVMAALTDGQNLDASMVSSSSDMGSGAAHPPCCPQASLLYLT